MSEFYLDNETKGVLKKMNIFRRIYLKLDTGRWPPKWAKYYTDVMGGNFGLLYPQEQENGDIKQIFFNYMNNHYVARFEYGGNKNYKIYDLSTGIEVPPPHNQFLSNLINNFEIQS